MDQINEQLERLLQGLQETPATISPLWFYDATGSALFEAITRLSAYYPTSAEMEILQHAGGEIAELLGGGCSVVELGSGSALKASALLGALESPRGYYPLDVSKTAVQASARAVRLHFDSLDVEGLTGNFHRDEDLAALLGSFTAEHRVLLFFPGSTIGNFKPNAAALLLRRLARFTPPRARLLIGVDLRKDERILQAAYNDDAGVTAAFNRNALSHINSRYDAGFDVASWAHEARWNDEEGRVEMWLRCAKNQTISLGGNQFEFREGDGIHTENSYKWSVDAFVRLAEDAGWSRASVWTDQRGYFSLMAFENIAEHL